jgi:sulfide:quinone oxidoreductase
MSAAQFRVVIAGGGVAGLEALMAVRALAGGRVDLTLIAPEDEFVYRPLGVAAPFAVERIRRASLDRAARDADAEFFPWMVTAVDPGERIVTTSAGRRLDYDALVLAVGARAVPTIAHATTWDDRLNAETIGGLVQDFEQGYSRSLAIVIPPGPGWPLRAYELALFITLDVKGMGIDIQTTIVTPEPAPLALLGPRALALVSKELEQAGIAVASADRIEVEQGHTAAVLLRPSGQRLEVDRVLALPGLRGRPIPGVPPDADGFVEVDEHCSVRGLDRVWAAGDGTAFPVKSGGFAALQADVAAGAIAAAAGVDVEPQPFDPGLGAQLSGLPAGRFITEWLDTGDGDALTTHLPASGVPVLTYLQRDLEAGWRGEI